MYVRWQTKKRTTSTTNLGDLLCATLVESRRIDGKPRQCVLKYLGSVRVGMLTSTFGASRIGGFWRSVTANLDELNIPDETRKIIEGKIAERVPRPSEKEILAVEANLRRILS